MFKNMNKGQFRTFGKPVVTVKINGKKVVDWIDFTVSISSLGDIDSFSVVLPWDVSDSPRDELLFSGSKASSVLVTGNAEISIEAGFEGEESKSIIIGKMDNARWSFDAEDGEIVEVYGRSLAASPYDFKEAVKFQNLTATDAHAQMAAKHGLNPIAPVKTNTMIGGYLNDDHASLAMETSHWDYVLYLAENEGFVSRVRGSDWYFGPAGLLPGYELTPLPFSWGHNILSPLELERAPNAARNLMVEVISWPGNTRKGNAARIVEKASFKNANGGHKYVIREYKPGLTRDEAQRLAQNLLEKLSMQQVSGSFYCDFFPELDNDRRIALHGVGKGLSLEYFVTGLEITGSANEGLRTKVEFSNLPLTGAGGLK